MHSTFSRKQLPSSALKNCNVKIVVLDFRSITFKNKKCRLCAVTSVRICKSITCCWAHQNIQLISLILQISRICFFRLVSPQNPPLTSGYQIWCLSKLVVLLQTPLNLCEWERINRKGCWLFYTGHIIYLQNKKEKTYFPFLSMQMPPLFILLSFKFTMCPFFSAVLEIFQSYFTVLFG